MPGYAGGSATTDGAQSSVPLISAKRNGNTSRVGRRTDAHAWLLKNGISAWRVMRTTLSLTGTEEVTLRMSGMDSLAGMTTGRRAPFLAACPTARTCTKRSEALARVRCRSTGLGLLSTRCTTLVRPTARGLGREEMRLCSFRLSPETYRIAPGALESSYTSNAPSNAWMAMLNTLMLVATRREVCMDVRPKYRAVGLKRSLHSDHCSPGRATLSMAAGSAATSNEGCARLTLTTLTGWGKRLVSTTLFSR
mmetsp:Transcript_8182/g.15984  ORF Transcript_8182/g.15984 Transcript_8182/m.15984 type:complete len:251 (+) Transcript_8182:4422-5174(+)